MPTIIRKRIQDVVKPFALEAQSNGIDLVLDLDHPSLSQVPYAITDPFRLGQVVVNLLGNAMRYAAEGATQRVAVKAIIAPEPPRYGLLSFGAFAVLSSLLAPSDTSCLPPTTPFVKTIQDGDHCYLYISVSGKHSITQGFHDILTTMDIDSGPGLAKEDVSLLFKRFSQATKQSNKVFGGSGLGLWISKQISHQSEYPH